MCFFKYVMWALTALCCGIMFALLFPIKLIAGIEALIIIALGISCCCKR